MAEVLFYHLTQTPLERTLPDLLEKSLQRGWRVLVKGGDAARLEFLDNALWTYRDDSFLPHARAGADHADQQPIYLTTGEEEPNSADILMLVDGARYPHDKMGGFSRVCLLFDGNDENAVAQARVDWKKTTEANFRAVYWAQEDGRWVQKAEHKP